jgi:outer membrane immunogenic protein
MKMHCIGFSAFALASIAAFASANAADLAVKAPVYKAPPLVAACIWCGWYIGANAGGSWSSDTAAYTQAQNNGAAAADITSSSAVGGGQIGYNWQMGSLVAGIETDFDGRHSQGTVNGLTPFAGNTIDQVNASQTQNWFGTVRGRIGWATGNFLFYGTGGLAYGNVEDSYTEIRVTTGQARSLSDSTTRIGWAAGAGVEYAFTKNLSAGVEYLHLDLGTDTLVNPASTSAGLSFATSQTSFKNTSDMVRAKLNWHFDWPVH